MAGMDEAEFEHTVADRLKQARKIETSAEQNRQKQPDFADWVKYQNEIHAAFERAARFDFRHQPDRLAWTLSDWSYLLDRMEQEAAVYSEQMDPEKTGVLNVREFGARADGVTDDAPAIRRAIEAAAKGPKRTVFLPKGNYLVGLPGDADGLAKSGTPELRIFSLNGIRNVLISGEAGTVFVTKHPRGTLFYLEECDNVRLRRFRKTSLRPFFAAGTIQKTQEPYSLIVKFDSATLSPLDPVFASSDGGGLIRAFQIRQLQADGVTPATFGKSGPPFWNPEIRALDDGLFEVRREKVQLHPWENFKDYREGDRVILYPRDYYAAAFELRDSHHCRIQEITLNAGSGIAFEPQSSSTLFLTDCVTDSLPENRHYATSMTADFYLSTGGSLGNYVARNNVRHHGDDFINVHTFVLPVHHQEGNVIDIPDRLTDDQRNNLREIELIRHSGNPTSVVHDKVTEETRKMYIADRFRVMAVQRIEVPVPVVLDLSKSSAGKLAGKPAPADWPKAKVLRLKLDRDPGELVVTAPYFDWKDTQRRNGWYREKFDMIHFPQFDSLGQVFAKNQMADGGVSRILSIGSGALLADNDISMRQETVSLFYPVANKFLYWWNEAYYPRVCTYKNNHFKTYDQRVFNLFDVDFDPQNRNTWSRHQFFIGNRVDFRPSTVWAHQPAIRIQGCDNALFQGNIFVSRMERGPVVEAQYVRMSLKDNEGRGSFKPDKFGDQVELLPLQ